MALLIQVGAGQDTYRTMSIPDTTITPYAQKGGFIASMGLAHQSRQSRVEPFNNGGERCIKTYAFDPNTGAPCDAWGWVGIDHGNGYISQYGHLQVSDIKVTARQKVTKGQLIGLSGKTTPPTDSVGPHLHFEVLKFVNGQYLFVDPYGWSSTTELDPLYCPDQITCLAARPVSTRLWE
jgi:Peptidase family M23